MNRFFSSCLGFRGNKSFLKVSPRFFSDSFKIDASKELQRPTGEIEIKQRSRRKKSFREMVLENYTIEICGGTRDVSPSVVLSSDNESYLFNCSEGSQRYFIQHKRAMVKVSHMFFTSVALKNTGGYPGFFLTLNEVSTVDKVTLYGPPEFGKYLHSSRHYVRRNKMDVETVEFDHKICQEKQSSMNTRNLSTGVQVSATVLSLTKKDPSSETDILYQTSHLGRSSDSTSGVKTTYENRCVPIASESAPLDTDTSESVPAENPSAASTSPKKIDTICYYIKTPTHRGVFDNKKATSLGVPNSSLRKNLVSGLPITLENGTVVNPEQCLGPSSPGHGCLIMDIPTMEHLEVFLQKSEEEKDFAFSALNKTVECIIHLSPLEVVMDAKYISWIGTFDATIEHVFADERLSEDAITFTSHNQKQMWLSVTSEKNFPLPKLISNPTIEADRQNIKNLFKNKKKAHFATRGMVFTFVPVRKRGISTIKYPAFDLKVERKTALKSLKEAGISLPNVQAEYANYVEPSDYDDKSIQLTTLGTGSSVPGKYRNVTGNLLEIKEQGLMLMDCGEGTYGQMLRLFGDQIDEKMKALKFIFISHMHADHNIGIFLILQKRFALFQNDANAPKTIVVGPAAMGDALSEMSHFFDLNYTFHSSHGFLNQSHVSNISNTVFTGDIFPGMVLQTTYVPHCRQAFGGAVTFPNSFKLCFSGDCRPSKKLIEIGQDSVINLHESTFEDEELERARKKMHSTTSEAINVGNAMKAQYNVLTHFSQRYPSIQDTNCIPRNSFAAFDLMSFDVKDLFVIPLFTPAINAILEKGANEESEDMATPSAPEKKKRAQSQSNDSRKKFCAQ